MGQGFQTSLRKIAANTLELPIENIDYDNPDTSKVVDSGPTAASRSTMIVGRLVERVRPGLSQLLDQGRAGQRSPGKEKADAHGEEALRGLG